MTSVSEPPRRPPSASDRRTAWSLVFGQFALLALIVLLPDRADWTVPPILFRTGDVAALVGILLMVVARSLAQGSVWVASTCVLLIVLINVKARWEERHLAGRFPDYLAYARHTPRFIPRSTRH